MKTEEEGKAGRRMNLGVGLEVGLEIEVGLKAKA